MLETGLEHLESLKETELLIKNNENVMISCGRMGPMCTPVYKIMEELREKYPHVAIMDMDFDIPAADFIRSLPECMLFMGLPFTVYFKKGVVVAATTSIQSKEAITDIIDKVFKQS